MTELHLRNNQIGDEGVSTLASAHHPRLELLSLSSNQIGDVGANHLQQAIESNRWPNLRQLYVGGNTLGVEKRAELKASCQKRNISVPYL